MARKAGAFGQLQIRGVIGRDVLAATKSFQIDVRPKRLCFEADGQCLEKIEILADLPFTNSLALAVGNKNTIGNLKCPDFRHDGIVGRKAV